MKNTKQTKQRRQIGLFRGALVSVVAAAFTFPSMVLAADWKVEWNPENNTLQRQAMKRWQGQGGEIDTVPAAAGTLVIKAAESVLSSPDWQRRDPSDIIRVGDTYYVWYTKIHKDAPGYPQGWAGTVWYATSKNGRDWEEQELAVGKGGAGAWDEGGTYTPNILAYKGRYYLAYTAVKAPFDFLYNKASIGMAVADSPGGPWTKLDSNPLIRPTDSLDAADGFECDDAVFVVRDEKIWLYYKGYPKIVGVSGKDVRVRTKSFLLVATADQPEGPYTKHPGILHAGHEAVLWKNADGSVGSLCTRSGVRRHYVSTDGIHFSCMHAIKPQKAIGLYRAGFEEGSGGATPTWGIAMKSGKKNGLLRIDLHWPPVK